MKRNRSRLVSFRLSQDELEELRVACLVRGARNLSEFAREAVLDVSGPRAQQHSRILDRVSALELRLTEVQTALHQTYEILQSLARAWANRETEKAQGKGA